MDQHEIPHGKKEALREAVVNGAFYGLLAGVFMELYVLLAGMVVAGSDWAYVRYLDLAHSGSPWQIIFTQLAVSVVLGAVFGLFCSWSRLVQERVLPTWLAGLAYSMLLWALAAALILPKDHYTLSTLSSVYLLFAYMVYGLLLGLPQRLSFPRPGVLK